MGPGVLPSSEPVKPGLARPMLVTGEIRLISVGVPPTLHSDIWADVWKPAGHATVDSHVVIVVSGPVVTTASAWSRSRSPGCVPTPASANPAVTSPVPEATTAKRMTMRRIVLAARHLLIAPRITLITGMNGRYSSSP
jgi:hypothetical protein